MMSRLSGNSNTYSPLASMEAGNSGGKSYMVDSDNEQTTNGIV